MVKVRLFFLQPMGKLFSLKAWLLNLSHKTQTKVNDETGLK